MSHYRCAEGRLATGEREFRLVDEAAGVDITVIPDQGAVWSAFGARDESGNRMELFHPAEHFTYPGGSPVLFPVTGRSACDGELGFYRHRGTRYPMPIHGFARDLPWDVEDVAADEAGARITCSLQDTEETRRVYPYAFRIALTYRIREGAVSVEAAVENPGEEPLPFHLGYHPYFRVPIRPDGDRTRCLMRVPSFATWELANLCATGRQAPIDPREAFEPERALGEETMDRVFAALRPDEQGRVCCWARDPEAGYAIEVEFDAREFPVFVVYTSPEAPYACLEPWTGLPGGLGDDTPSGQQAQRVPPGGRVENTVCVRVRRA